jgi:feruloyl esterase
MRIGFNHGWRSWKLGNYTSTTNNSLDLVVGSSAMASIFTTPPTPVDTSGGQIAYGLSVNLTQAARAMTVASGVFREPAVDFMRADSTDLSAFRDRGGKLIIVHGTADPVFSIADTVDWWNALNKVEGERASQFVRLYAVAGMNHCGGGPSTDQFDAVAALVEWVEKGTAPDRIVATARAVTLWPGRARPLCPYPQQARYSASGSIEDASSFVCRAIRPPT